MDNGPNTMTSIPRQSRNKHGDTHQLVLFAFVVLGLILGLAALSAGGQVFAASWASKKMNSLCSPVKHGTVLGRTDQTRVSFDSPWWAPDALKTRQLYHFVCGDRPRTRLEWVFEKQSGTKSLHRLVLLDIDGLKPGEQLLEKKKLVSASIGWNGILITKKKGTEVFPAPWILDPVAP